MKRLRELKISPLGRPKEGLFGGRTLPKEKINSASWITLFNAEAPPDDGLYVLRHLVSAPDAGKKQAKRVRKTMPINVLWQATKAAMENKPNKSKSGHTMIDSNPRSPADEKMRALRTKDWPDAKLDWNDLSPDVEAELLGLQNLQKSESLAIIGAGISGLTLAWILNRVRPDIRIDIYDQNSDVGGWMRSELVAPGVLFEAGPRTILPSHPGTTILREILEAVDAGDQLVGVPKSSPTNTKGLVYNGQVVKLPSNMWEALKFMSVGSLLKGLKVPLFREVFKATRDPTVNDESVASFIGRRFGPGLNSRMISAIMRGIYGGDSSKLSARSVARFNRLYYLERTQDISVLAAAFTGSMSYLDSYGKEVYPLLYNALTTGERDDQVTAPAKINRSQAMDVPKHSLYALKNGIQSLATAIAKDLDHRRNVNLHLGVKVSSISNVLRADGRDQISFKTSHGGVASADVVMSTIAKPGLVEDAELAGLLGKIEYSSLAVVNVHTVEPIAKDWFGILVPKSEDSWNKDGVLGIIFDSSVRAASQPVNAIAKEGDIASAPPATPASGSTMTVMIGGDLWSEMTEEEATTRALNGIEKLLGPFDRSKVTTKATIQRDCIPQYTVGYSDLAQAVHDRAAKAYGNKLGFMGMALGRGVGVSDAALDAMLVAARFSDQRRLLYPRFFFGEWLSRTRPNLFA